MMVRRSTVPSRFLLVALLLAAAACSSEAPPPAQGANLLVRRPLSPADDPFGLSGDKFVAVTAEVPGKVDGSYQVVKPYVPGGTSLTLECGQEGCTGIPYGLGLQLRVELWSVDPATGKPAAPVLARGKTVPFDHQKGGSIKNLTPYVTRLNRFSPLYGEDSTVAEVEGLAGSTSVALPQNTGEVLIIGGGRPAAGKKNAYDPASYEFFSDGVALYSPSNRSVQMISDAGPEYRLTKGRAFHSSAVGNGVVAVVGGYVNDGGAIKLTNSVEFIDAQGKIKEGAPLAFARAGATVVQLFANSNYFLILGGKGETPCFEPIEAKTACELDSECGNGDTCVAKVCNRQLNCAGNTWELWHPTEGNKAQGRLNAPRWNQAAVRLPGVAGGYVMLIGGESEAGVRQDFEVVQFTTLGGGMISRADAECDPNVQGFGDCGNSSFFWRPLTQTLPQARTMAAATYVAVPRNSPILDYRHVYIVGGFSDKEHTKAIGNVQVFDVNSGAYLSTQGYPMQFPRGAPMVAAVQGGPNEGQVLIAGGSTTESIHLASAELIYVKVDKSTGVAVPTIEIAPVENDMPGGNRTLGTVTPLNTGHVLLTGGVGTGQEGLVGQNAMSVWSPF
jgi:hypothetical protein